MHPEVSATLRLHDRDLGPDSVEGFTTDVTLTGMDLALDQRRGVPDLGGRDLDMWPLCLVRVWAVDAAETCPRREQAERSATLRGREELCEYRTPGGEMQMCYTSSSKFPVTTI